MSDKCPVIFFLLFPLLLCSQSSDRLERTANDLFENGDYGPALEVYLLLHEENPGDPERLARMGVCCFENNQLEDAKGYLDQSIKLSENPSATTYLYLGKLHHSYLDFEGAIANYKLFLKKSSDKNPQRRAVKDDIKRCANGMMVRRKPPLGEVVNIGEPVNSDADECAPLFSPNYEGIIYFAAERKNNAGADSLSYDICFTEKNSGGWVSPMSLDSALNSSKNELPLGFNEKGQALYFFRGNTLFSGDVLVDTFKEDAPGKNTFHVKFDSPAQTWEGDCCLQFFNDSILLFASRRPGGFGGLDIYVATLEPTGWSVPKNLGPTINSAYDDRSPFLAPDGRTLYFSTNDRQRSMGGLDILRSVFLDWAQNWTPPENLGIPFNSAGDEEGFSLSENGVQALFSSSRKTGFGQRDIFLGFFFEKQTQQLQRSNPVAFHLTDLSALGEKTLEQDMGQISSTPSVLEFNPIIYTDPQMPLPEESLADLKKVADWLKKYPLLKMVFVGYAEEGDDGLESARTTLQKVASFLIDENVPLRQFKLQAVGDLSISLKKETRQIDLFIVNPEILPIPIKPTSLEGATFKQKFFRKTMNSLVYQVQVPIKGITTVDELLHFYPEGILMEHPVNNQVWFTPGYQLSWAAALETEQAIKKVGFFDAETVPLLNGWELSKKEAARHLHEYPALTSFIERD